MTDGNRLLIDAVRRIDRDSIDAQIDEDADRIELVLAPTLLGRCYWVRELLFRYRGLRLGDGSDREPFLALVARAGAAGLLRPSAVHALRNLAGLSASRDAVAAGGGTRG